jgi:hypothetical protein
MGLIDGWHYLFSIDLGLYFQSHTYTEKQKQPKQAAAIPLREMPAADDALPIIATVDIQQRYTVEIQLLYTNPTTNS